MIVDVHHVGIAVRDLERACAFFAAALRLPVVKEGDAPARGARVAVLGVSGSYLEIIAPTQPWSPFASFIAEHGEGLHHVALASDCVDHDVAKLRACRVALEDTEPREGFTGRLSYLAPEAFDGAVIEVVEPSAALPVGTGTPVNSPPVHEAFLVTGIDHVVLSTPDPRALCQRFGTYFDIPTKRTFERGSNLFAFLKPGKVIIEIVGPLQPTDAPAGKENRVSGLAFEVVGIDAMTESLRSQGYPVGVPHVALQGGRIVSVHPSAASGAPVAFIDYEGKKRGKRAPSP